MSLYFCSFFYFCQIRFLLFFFCSNLPCFTVADVVLGISECKNKQKPHGLVSEHGGGTTDRARPGHAGGPEGGPSAGHGASSVSGTCSIVSGGLHGARRLHGAG